jgi:hypothetical protein
VGRYPWFPPAVAHFLYRNYTYRALEHWCREVVASSGFHVGLVLVILFNICILAIEANGVDGKLAMFTFVANAVCTFIFSIELIMQIIALNVPTFFSSNFNIVDTIIVIISLAELAIS